MKRACRQSRIAWIWGCSGTERVTRTRESCPERGARAWLLARLVTRIYFADEQAANESDPVLCALPETADARTLIAVAQDGGYRFDIHLQGDGETVFFAL